MGACGSGCITGRAAGKCEGADRARGIFLRLEWQSEGEDLRIADGPCARISDRAVGDDRIEEIADYSSALGRSMAPFFIAHSTKPGGALRTPAIFVLAMLLRFCH